MRLKKRVIARIVTFIIMTAFMTGFCRGTAVMTHAQTDDTEIRYDLTFTSKCPGDYEGSRTYTAVRINTEDTRIGYGELGEIIMIDGKFMMADDISTVGVESKYDVYFSFNNDDKEFRVVKAFTYPITLFVRGYHADWLAEVEVTCRKNAGRYKVTVTDDGHGTGSADPSNAYVGTTVPGVYSIYGQPYPGALMGKMIQGPAAWALLDASRPNGWIEAFTFNLSMDGKTDNSLKNGVMPLIIPTEYRKAGRFLRKQFFRITDDNVSQHRMITNQRENSIMRLDRYLTASRTGSRSEVKDLVRKGQVS